MTGSNFHKEQNVTDLAGGGVKTHVLFGYLRTVLVGLYENFAKFVAKVPLGARGAQFRESFTALL